MSYYKVKLFFCVISTLPFVNQALNAENIRGGSFAKNNTFLYNVVIFKTNPAFKDGEMLCTGGIIAEDFVLSDAECIRSRIIELKLYMLFVAAGQTDINHKDKITALIKEVYFAHYSPKSEIDIVVLKLNKKLIELNSHLIISILRLPYPDQSFILQEGVVAGFGYNMVDIRANPVTGEPELCKGKSSGLLKYGNVSIIDNHWCKKGHPNFVSDMQMCGVMSAAFPGEPAGICIFDNGAPLVINGIVAGIASIRNGNCDDTVKGSIYTNVSHYTRFIQACMARTPWPGTYTVSARSA